MWVGVVLVATPPLSLLLEVGGALPDPAHCWLRPLELFLVVL